MTKAKRILVEDVRAAYQKCGRKPVKDSWVRGDCCCPSMAMFLANNPEPRGDSDDPYAIDLTHDAIMWMHENYGVHYSQAFVNGVDGAGDIYKEHFEERQIGYTDGRAAAEAMFGGDK